MRRFLWVILFALAAWPVFAKSLRWRALDVTARLDRDGRLHVTERQAIVFDGDWNGGERTFRIEAGQDLAFESIARVEGGVEHPLVAGNLDAVDHYAFTSPTVLRWRSRLPTDPPFDHKEITYVVKYTMSGVVRKTDGDFHLNHDFAFPDRPGVIERYSLRLDLDPVWRGANSPIVITRRTLVSGEGVVVPLRLEFAGGGAPASVTHTPSRKLGIAVCILFGVVFAFLLFDFLTGERHKGRFGALLRREPIDEAWLRENLFVLEPESVGAILHGRTGPDDVAALLARMALEKKISTAVDPREGFLKTRQVLTMRLLVERKDLPATERALVNALFMKGETTDTDKIQAHYKGTGFDPASIVERGVGPTVQRLRAQETKRDWKRTWGPLIAAFVLLIVAAATGGNNTGVAVAMLFAGVFVMTFAGIAATANARGITTIVPRLALALLILSPLIYIVVRYSLASVRLLLNPLTLIAICAWALALTKTTLELLHTQESAEMIAWRKKLRAAQSYFKSELRSPQPRLRDDWFPYLLAFGLGRNVGKWFGAHGATASGSDFSSPSSTSSSSMTTSPSFTGGGGAFGGAGASGGWAVAAAGIGAGVSSPSSGGGGSGGGDSGSSSSSSDSGGGGGGGW